jgi:hypothetical protein
MDNMLQHPWTELQLLIKEKWLTQKAFASILWKKVSEVNELLKWKRNITIQRDYLLHQTVWTPIKYWILKQVDYDYSLIDIEETDTNNPDSVPMTDQDWNSEQIKNEIEPELNWVSANTSFWTSAKDLVNITPVILSDSEESRTNDLTSLDSSTSLRSSLNDNTTQNENKPQKTAVQEQETEIDEDFKNRVNIFRNF